MRENLLDGVVGLTFQLGESFFSSPSATRIGGSCCDPRDMLASRHH